MDAIDVLLSRQSTKATLLADPAPDDAQLLDLLQTGMSAPDHGAIRPWRFKVIRGEARERLSDVFESALKNERKELRANLGGSTASTGLADMQVRSWVDDRRAVGYA